MVVGVCVCLFICVGVYKYSMCVCVEWMEQITVCTVCVCILGASLSLTVFCDGLDEDSEGAVISPALVLRREY